MKMHFVGCKGVSMAQLMKLVEAQGIETSGSDVLLSGHNAINVSGADVVVYTSAINCDNVELVEARRLGIPRIERAALLGQISQNYGCIVAIAGAHGKTTTTTMIGATLSKRRATIHVGGDSVGIGGNCVLGKQYFVTEACEYRRNFLHLKPTVGVILNFALDHIDYYKDEADLWDAYQSFANMSKTVVAHASIVSKLVHTKDIISFGKGGDYTAQDIKFDKDGTNFDCYYQDTLLGKVHITTQGFYNIDNALACIATCKTIGIEWEELNQGLSSFSGVKRRFEIVKQGNFGTIISDYAHHPQEIEQCIATAKSIYKSVRVIFQPHTYTRTKAFLQEFANCLSKANQVALAPIFAARENSNGTTSQDLANIIPNAIYLKTVQDIVDFIYGGDVGSATIVMGAGDIERLI
ncbi:MAG: Mur ligase family protein [Firmicutes bacterium]|nr:Mur ligase family protein [Bacillota bacterium]MCL1944945.1 Mur ligase family protein [Bacillota bacterium]MCL1953452.1 Mur ligase family protein [Bacillota bacterium]